MKNYAFRSNHRRRWPLFMGLLVIIGLIVIGGTVFGIRHFYTENLRPVNSKATDEIVVAIPSGASVKEISGLLKQKEVIRQVWSFERYVSSHELGDKLQAGTYKFKQSQSVQTVVAMLVDGKVAVDLFTILPGQRLDQLRDTFIHAGYSAAVVDEALDPAQYAGNPALTDKPAGASLEGYLFPESFQKTAETSPKLIIEGALNELAQALTPDLRAGFARQGLTTHQAIILGSIIEKEVSSQDDRNTAAQVFLKRIKEGTPLQSDVTVLYGSILAGQKPPRLDFDSPYNTFKHTGLPKGPIGNVTASGLIAVANPSPTDYLYFVAGDDGKTYFAKTNEEHQNNVRQYCKKLCSQ